MGVVLILLQRCSKCKGFLVNVDKTSDQVELLRFSVLALFSTRNTSLPEVRLKVNSFIESLPNYYLNMSKLKQEMKNSLVFSESSLIITWKFNTGSFLVSPYIQELLFELFYEEFKATSLPDFTLFYFDPKVLWKEGSPKTRFKKMVVAPIEEAILNLKTRDKSQKLC